MRRLVERFKAAIREEAPNIDFYDAKAALKEALREAALDRFTAIFARDATIPPPPPRTRYDYLKIAARTVELRAEGKGTEQIAKEIQKEEGISRRQLDNIWTGWSTSFDRQK